ncbi:hypothetical protein CCACVL1_31011, partial [Corchorus capsularis]
MVQESVSLFLGQIETSVQVQIQTSSIKHPKKRSISFFHS